MIQQLKKDYSLQCIQLLPAAVVDKNLTCHTALLSYSAHEKCTPFSLQPSKIFTVNLTQASLRHAAAKIGKETKCVGRQDLQNSFWAMCTPQLNQLSLRGLR